MMHNYVVHVYLYIQDTLQLLSIEFSIVCEEIKF